MIIITQKQDGIVNFESVIALGREDNQISAAMSGESLLLGVYETEDRAKEIMSEIIEAVTKQRIDVIPLPEK